MNPDRPPSKPRIVRDREKVTWVEVHGITAELHAGYNARPAGQRAAPKAVDLVLRTSNLKGADGIVALHLCDLTEAELDFLASAVDRAVAAARPVVRENDARAAAAAAAGDDTDPRHYRGVPRVVERPWFVGPDGGLLWEHLVPTPRPEQ